MKYSVEWKVGGQQGEGIDSTGEIFAKTLFRYGYYITTYKQFASRIKGGHTNFKIRATSDRNYYAGDSVDILLCLDNETLELNKHELKKGSVVIMESKETEILDEEEYIIAKFPLKQIASELGNSLAKNMILLGISGALISLPSSLFDEYINDVFSKKGVDVINSNIEAIRKGYELVQTYLSKQVKTLPYIEKNERLLISGNEATAFGSLIAGCKFLSAYPITPASEIMEWLSQELPHVGGTVMQVEDEIAGIGFAIGAAYSGVRAMTSTSGPGLSLKTEMLGLAGISETPIVIVNSQRGGPSTGLPTKHEQSDMQHSLHGGHGEIPRIVVYPATIEDAFYIATESFNLAEVYQCPVIICLDLALSMNKSTIPSINSDDLIINRGKLLSEEEALSLSEHQFKRYRFTEDGVSPRVIPGTQGGVHTANSNEHSEEGFITEDPLIRTKMMNKRMEKINSARLSKPFYSEDINSDIILVGTGSTYGVIKEVLSELRGEGLSVGHIQIQQLLPLPINELGPSLEGKKVIVIENNYNGQLLQWIKQHLPIHNNSHSITQYDGNPFVMKELYEQVKELV